MAEEKSAQRPFSQYHLTPPQSLSLVAESPDVFRLWVDALQAVQAANQLSVRLAVENPQTSYKSLVRQYVRAKR